MAETDHPLSDDDAERLLHDFMQRIVEERGRKPSPEAHSALTIAMAGLYGALMNFERSRRREP